MYQNAHCSLFTDRVMQMLRFKYFEIDIRISLAGGCYSSLVYGDIASPSSAKRARIVGTVRAYNLPRERDAGWFTYFC